MAKTTSIMLDLGTSAPDFTLLEPASGQLVSRMQFFESPLLIMFICNHCPFVVHILDGLVDFAREYGEKGLKVVAINANDVSTHPDDSPEKMAELARQKGLTFSYLFDESQAVAKAFSAACTPDFFLFDAQHKLAYRGQFDGARPGNGVPVTGQDMRAAADAVLAGQQPSSDQKASMGCNIKWIAGHEPDYF